MNWYIAVLTVSFYHTEYYKTVIIQAENEKEFREKLVKDNPHDDISEIQVLIFCGTNKPEILQGE